MKLLSALAAASLLSLTCLSGAYSAESRPSYNTSSGFFVKNGKLYDATGSQFVPRGVITVMSGMMIRVRASLPLMR